MSSWRYLYYADAVSSGALADSFIDQVAYIARNAGGAAVYRCRTDDGGVHYYFSPQASFVAERFSARPCSCPRPDQRGELVAGRTEELDES